jgi:hypothetical protein
MQHVRKLGSFTGQQPSVAPLRVTTFRPSLRERVGAWVRSTLTAETLTEVALGTFTISLLVWLFVGLQRALENYTIIPWP